MARYVFERVVMAAAILLFPGHATQRGCSPAVRHDQVGVDAYE